MGARAQTASPAGSALGKGSSSSTNTANRFTGSSGSKELLSHSSLSIEKPKQSTGDDDFKTFGNKDSQKKMTQDFEKDKEYLETKLKKYLSKPTKEATTTFHEELKKLKSVELKQLAESALFLALDRVSNQPIIADLYTYIYLKPATLDLPDLIELIRDLLENDEYRVDYPKLDEYIGVLLANIFLKAPNDVLRNVFSRMLPPTDSHSIVIMKNVLSNALTNSNKDVVSQRWNAANITWDEFSNDQELVEKYKSNPELQYLNVTKSSVAAEPKTLINEITSKIIKDAQENFDPVKVADAYKSKVSDKDSGEVLRTLFPYFLEKSYEPMAKSKDMNKGLDTFKIHFDKYCILLSKIKSTEVAEIDKSLIKMVSDFNILKERPKDLLFSALDIMYSNYLIDEDALKNWNEDKQCNQIDRTVVSKLIESIDNKSESEN